MVSPSRHACWRVLVVDDDPDVHPLLEVMFETDGRFSLVGQAGDAGTALALADRHRPHAVLLDLSLGETEGWAVLPELRRRLPEARILVFSAFPEPVTLVQALGAGADAYLNKASAWELIPVLEQLLASRDRPAVETPC